MRLPFSVEGSEAIELTEQMFDDLKILYLGDVLPVNRSISQTAPETFRNLFGGHPAAVTVITTEAPNGDLLGVTATAVMSLSLEPPQLLVSLDNKKYTLKAIEQCGKFAVNFLSDDQVELSNTFARPGQNKFANVIWDASEHHGMPWLAGARANVECVAERFIRSGDHTLIVGGISSAQVRNEVGALLYGGRTYGKLGGIE